MDSQAPRAEAADAQAGPHPQPGPRPAEAARVVAGPAEVVPAGIAGRAASIPAAVVARGARVGGPRVTVRSRKPLARTLRLREDL